MSRILVLMHEHSRPWWKSAYLVSTFIRPWIDMGHDVNVAFSPYDLPDADIAFLHVDLSVTPPEYVAAAARYPRVINSRVLDIRKRKISSLRVHPGDPWDGPVLFKPDLNFAGIPEMAAAGKDPGGGLEYRLFRSMATVPPDLFNDERYVAERFIPERDGDKFVIRSYVFFGDRERCRRFLSPEPIAKGRKLVPAEPVPVPPEIRAARARLGFDFGKFDFIMHGSEAVLLDANRTPGAPPPVAGLNISSVSADLAAGVNSLLK